jgi:hypothetical protein
MPLPNRLRGESIPPCNDFLLLRRDLFERGFVEIQMGRRHLRWHSPDPVVQRDIHKPGSLEHLKEEHIGVARVLDVVPCHSRNKANIVRMEIHRPGPPFGHNNRHAPRAREPELPLGRIGVPVQLTHAAGP